MNLEPEFTTKNQLRIQSERELSDGADGRKPLIMWRNVITVATMASNSPGTVGASAASARSYATYDAARMSRTAAQGIGDATLTAVLDSVATVDYIAIAGITARASSAVNASSVQRTAWLEVREPGGSFIPMHGSPFIIDDPCTIAVLFEPVAADAIRLRVEDVEPGGEVVIVPVIMSGVALRMERPVYQGHSPITMSRVTTRQTQRSRGGQFIGQRIRRTGLQGNLSLNNLSSGFIRDEIDPMIEAVRTQPFFIAWRPDEFPSEIAYAWIDDDAAPSNSGPRDLMEIGLPLTGYQP